MTSEPGDPHSTAGLKDAVGRIRERAGELFRFGAKGLQVAAFLSEETDRFLVSQFEQAAGANGNLRHELCERCAVLAVGGSGRRDPAPWSDTDLLFLSRGSPDGDFNGFSSTVVRNLWDAGLRLGHTVQSVRDALTMSLEEIQFATSLADARLLWGSEAMFQQFHNRFARRCLERRLKRFVRQCVAERLEERAKYGATVNQLEPDVKRSLGGLRDLHLIRWIGFAWYRVSDFNGLRGRGALSYDDARSIQSAYEFLMHLRTDLHFSAGKEHDVLNRDEQLRIANARGFEEQSGQRPVERFMQTYFRHTAAVSRISDHFVDRHQPGSFLRSALSRLVTHRFDGVYEVGPHGINVATAHLDAVCGDIGRILRLYHAALLYDTRLSPKLVDTIRTRVAEMESVDMVSRECGKVFRRILRGAGNTGRIVREMYATGVLEYMIPEMARTRGLLQFNQYHSFTVDEHTLRAIEAVRRRWVLRTVRYDTRPRCIWRCCCTIRARVSKRIIVWSVRASPGASGAACK